jgi:amidase
MNDPAGPRMTRKQAFAIGRLDAHGQAALVAKGEVAPADLVEAAIVRIDALDSTLKAVSFRDDDAARRRAAAATGPMAGVPWLVKDGLDYPGMPTRSGSRSNADAKPGTIAFPYVDRIDATGLVAVAKSSAPEFGLLPTTESLLYGPARNPWALDRSPGGSSGGAAVAVASGMVPLAHAADGGGSIRIPASCCGLVGLKPGRGGNVRARPPHVIEDLLVGDTLLSRSVRDVAWATAATAPNGVIVDRPIARRLRIAVIAEGLEGGAPDPDVARALDSAAKLCASLGHMVEVAPLPVDGPAVAKAFRTIWGYLARDAAQGTVARLGDAADDLMEPWTRDLAAWCDGIDAMDTDALYLQVGLAGAAMDALFARYDIILSPVLRWPAVAIGELAPDRAFDHLMSRMFDYVSYTPLHNLTGLPALSLPLHPGDESGVPIGSMFAAGRGQEALLLALALELEEAAPWADRWPNWSIGGAFGATG